MATNPGIADFADYNARLRAAKKRSPAEFAAVESEGLNTLFRDQYSQALAREKDSGLQTRARILQVSPELARTSAFLTDAFTNPLPSYLQDTYSEYLRGAQAARGFGGGGTGVTGEEARYLMNVADQRRRELLPFQTEFGGQMMGMMGLGGAQQASMGDVFSIHERRKALSIQNQARRDQRNQGYISAATAVLGTAIGSGGIMGAFANYQQGRAAQAQNRGFATRSPYEFQSDLDRMISRQMNASQYDYLDYGSTDTGAYRPQAYPTPEPMNPGGTGSLFFSPNVIQGDTAYRANTFRPVSGTRRY